MLALRHEQIALRNPRSNPEHALRGVQYAFGLADHGRKHQYRFLMPDWLVQPSTTRRYVVVAKAVQCDEIWSFSYANNKNVKFAKAQALAWTAIDADSKLIVSCTSATAASTPAFRSAI